MVSPLGYALSAEVAAYRQLCARGVESVECGLRIVCPPGVFPPWNRVSRCLAEALVRRRARRVLDLGCGSGLLALVAAAWAEQVVAVDCSALAVHATAANAERNGLRNLEAVLGDGYAPVSGRRFDLVVSNPPFYDPPSTEGPWPEAMFCLGPKPLLHHLLEGLHAHLAPAGRALFVSSSLSDNSRIEALALENGLRMLRTLLSRGQAGSQDVFLWEASPITK